MQLWSKTKMWLLLFTNLPTTIQCTFFLLPWIGIFAENMAEAVLSPSIIYLEVLELSCCIILKWSAPLFIPLRTASNATSNGIVGVGSSAISSILLFLADLRSTVIKPLKVSGAMKVASDSESRRGTECCLCHYSSKDRWTWEETTRFYWKA